MCVCVHACVRACIVAYVFVHVQVDVHPFPRDHVDEYMITCVHV